MKAWGAGGGPDSDTLAELMKSFTDVQIAERYGVRPQTVQYWRKRAGLRRNSVKGIDHRLYYLPWSDRSAEHASDPIARRLREAGRAKAIEKGDPAARPLDSSSQKLLDEFLLTLRSNNWVVDYERERGFLMRPRDRKLDKPLDLIRRPPGSRLP